MLKQKQVVSFFQTKPVFLFLLPAFFVLHGSTRNYNAVTFKDGLLLMILYTGCALVAAGLAWFFYRDIVKACIIAFFLMLYHFFFGNIQDMLKSLSPQTFLSQYRFILPVSLLLFCLLILGIKKRKKPLLRFGFYLNILLLTLIVIDTGWLVSRLTLRDRNNLLNPGTATLRLCDTCQKPDIYLILVDQYAGNTALKDVFGFDNTQFVNELTSRGFHVAKKSSSNYNLTPFSMASLLNMDYLTPEMGVKKHLNVSYSYRLIKNSSVVQFLAASGYQFYNYSIFDFPGYPAHQYHSFLPYGTKLITAQTFTGRLDRDIRTGIMEGKFGTESLQKKILYEDLHFNDSIIGLTRHLAAQRTANPKFVYSHLMIPHHPYYFDSRGDSLPLKKLMHLKDNDSNDYIEYLRYGNKKILQLIDDIVAGSPAPPVIMLLSDHGFRHPAKTIDRKYDFMNLNAIFLPDKNYSQFNDSLTNVNHFRVFFNSCFDQHLVLLKDSTIDLWD